jgi:threonine/homoserine/homoserine lactone efflux protein
MNFHLLIAFFIGLVILAATPGPGVFASMAKAAAEGFKSALFLIGGLVLGDILFLIAALLGLSVIAKMLGSMFFLIRLAGGIYLFYLGFRIFRSTGFPKWINADNKTNYRQSFVVGFLTTMGNPKPILFYASVLPTIINFNKVRFTDALVMIALIPLVSFLVVGSYSYVASLSHKINMSDKLQSRINKTAGLIMMVVGVFVIIK